MLRSCILAAALLCALNAALSAKTRESCDLGGTQVQSVPDPVSGRAYDIEITLPSGYEASPKKRYPVLYYADGGHQVAPAACLTKEPRRQEALRLIKELNLREEPILIGLSYARDGDYAASRARDYTMVAIKPGYGAAAAYQRYIAETVIPHVERRYRTDPKRRLFWGHSYGGLLGARILFTQPNLFRSYILGSPSFWFADDAIFTLEADYAKAHRDLKANVFIYVGGDEIRRYDPERRGDTEDMVADVKTFEKRVKARKFPGLTIRSFIVPGKNHRTTIPPGFSWAIRSALGGGKAALPP